VEHEYLNSELSQPDKKATRKNIKKMIYDIIGNHETEELSYLELLNKLSELTGKDNDEANIKGRLKALEGEGIIEMADGHTWKRGIKIRKENIS
jgi:hypothetical protein